MIAATQALNVTSSRARGAKPAMGPEPATCPFAETSGNDGVTTLSDDLNRLVAGEKAAWDGFVQRYARVIYAAVQRRLVPAGRAHEACSRDFKLLRNYDPGRAKLSTWLTVIANSTTIDHLRRQAAPATDIDALPQSLLAVEPKLPERIKIPPELLSPRQALVIELLYRRELEVAEAAEVMGVNPQTVRSMHHKALVKLRAHFQEKAD
jgi:RNA polymerase sigma-70 factor (ECF subfamily)